MLKMVIRMNEDVYKRQRYNCIHVDCCPSTWIRTFHFYIRSRWTVSYTHLDVYKRQVRTLPRSVCPPHLSRPLYKAVHYSLDVYKRQDLCGGRSGSQRRRCQTSGRLY